MKKIMIGLTLMVLSINLFSQPYYYDEIPSIYKIDAMEKIFIEKNGLNDLIRFYQVLEHGAGKPEDILFRDNDLFRCLEIKNITFIINGWLYVLSYEPNANKSHNEFDYRDTGQPFSRKIFLYKKNVINRTDWELANNNTIFYHGFGGSMVNQKINFNPINIIDGGTSKVIKLPSYKDVIVIFAGMSIRWNRDYILNNVFMVLIPTYLSNGSIYFDIKTLDLPIDRPVVFTGLIDGKIIETNEKLNNGKLKRITLDFLYNSNDEISRVNIDGDYEYSIAGVNTQIRNGRKYILSK